MIPKQEHILIIKLGALGDFIQALGAMKAIRRHHKNAHITLLTTSPFKSFAEKSEYFNAIKIDSRPKFYQLGAWVALKKTLNEGSFTRVYDLQNNDRTGFYFKLFRHPKPEWVGIAKGASHRNTSPSRNAGLAFYGHRQTLGLAGIKTVEIDQLKWIKEDVSCFDLPSRYALIVPGSAPKRPKKRWPVKNYNALCHALLKAGITPVLIGTQDEKETTENIMKACCEARDLTAQTSLFDIAALAQKAEYAIGNDTGPMHIIAPTGCHTLVLFSEYSNPVRHSPLGGNVQTIQQKNLADLKTETVLKKLNLPQ